MCVCRPTSLQVRSGRQKGLIMKEKSTQEIKVISKDAPILKSYFAGLKDANHSISEGYHTATIASLEYRLVTDNYSDDKAEIPRLVPTFDVVSDDGEEATLTKYFSILWSEKSNLRKLAKATQRLPDHGDNFDPDTLIGAKLIVVVENKEKDGKTYSNIVDFLPPKVAKKAKAPQPPQIEVEFEDEEEDDDVEDYVNSVIDDFYSDRD